MQGISDRMQEALQRIATAGAVGFLEMNRNTMRALERRSLIRHIKTRNEWTLTAAGKRKVAEPASH